MTLVQRETQNKKLNIYQGPKSYFYMYYIKDLSFMC